MGKANETTNVNQYFEEGLKSVLTGSPIEVQINAFERAIEKGLSPSMNGIAKTFLLRCSAKEGAYEKAQQHGLEARRAIGMWIEMEESEIELFANKGCLSGNDAFVSKIDEFMVDCFKNSPKEALFFYGWPTSFFGIVGPEQLREDLSLSERMKNVIDGWAEFPTLDSIRLYLGMLNYENQNVESGIELFEEVIKGKDAHMYSSYETTDMILPATVRTLLGTMYKNAKQSQEAVREWNKVIAIKEMKEEYVKDRVAVPLTILNYWITKAEECLSEEGEVKKEREHYIEIRSKLKAAYSYIKEVENKIEEFRENVILESEVSASVPDEAGLMRIVSTGMKSRYIIGKEKRKLLKDLDMALSELKDVEQKDPDAQLDVEVGFFSIPMIKSFVSDLKGVIHLFSGDHKSAIKFFEDSLRNFEREDTYYKLATAFEAATQPKKAYDTYNKCINYSPDSELANEARKEIQRLESKRIGKKWFMGSWKVLLILTGITILCLVFTLSGNPSGITVTFIFGIITGVYWWKKWR